MTTTGGEEMMTTGGEEMTTTGGEEMMTTGGEEMMTTGGEEMMTTGGEEMMTTGGEEMMTTGGEEMMTTNGGTEEMGGSTGGDIGGGEETGGSTGGDIGGGETMMMTENSTTFVPDPMGWSWSTPAPGMTECPCENAGNQVTVTNGVSESIAFTMIFQSDSMSEYQNCLNLGDCPFPLIS